MYDKLNLEELGRLALCRCLLFTCNPHFQGYPQYTICKELFSFLHHGIPTPLTEEMRRALLLPKDPVRRLRCVCSLKCQCCHSA